MKNVNLPLVSPIYSVSHGQGTVTSILYSNGSMRNWYLNNSMVLSVQDENPSGFFQPHVDVCQSGPEDNPFIERQKILLTFLDGSVNRVIRNMIDKGYYVYFGAIDDYYMKGRYGYHNKHYLHDGLICGYNQIEKTYSVYAYDVNMRYRVFQMPQICLERARKSTEKMGSCGCLIAMKPMQINIEFDPYIIKTKIQEHLDPPITNNSLEENTTAYGIIVHKYLIKYIEMFHDKDSDVFYFELRPFKMILEHKQFMLERIKKIEEYFCMNDSISSAYSSVVADAKFLWNMCLYYAKKYDKNKIPAMKLTLEKIYVSEKSLLSRLISLY